MNDELLALADRMEQHVISRLPGSEPVVKNGAWQMMLDAATALRRLASSESGGVKVRHQREGRQRILERVLSELMDRRLLNDVDDDLHQEIAEALICAARGDVTVKEFEWSGPINAFPTTIWEAKTAFGHYVIEEVSASDCPAYEARFGGRVISVKDDVNDAKAAAQADYEARIKSALVEVPTGNGEPEPVAWPVNLHPRTLDLVQRFALALAKKLRLAEEKYGHTDGWSRDDWEAECRDHLYQHLEKGDPRDVAAYCAFMWHHGWITYRPEITAPPADAWMREAFVRALASLAAAISILERTPKAKKAVASDKIFDTMLDDYRKALEAGRQALTAPGATTKSDGGLTPNATTIAAIKELERGGGEIGAAYGEYTPVTVRGSTSDPSSTRSDVTVEVRAKIDWWLREISDCNERMWNGSRETYFGQIDKGVDAIRKLLDTYKIGAK